jgi:hypothetical protein
VAALRVVGPTKVALTAVRVFYVLLASQSPMLPSEELGSEANSEFARQSLEGCFGLLRRLAEVECIVAVLKLLTLFVMHSGKVLRQDALSHPLILLLIACTARRIKSLTPAEPDPALQRAGRLRRGRSVILPLQSPLYEGSL